MEAGEDLLCGLAGGLDAGCEDVFAGDEGAQRGADAVGHEHEQALCRGARLNVRLLVNVDAAGDVEEVKGHAVDDAAEDEEDVAGETGAADAEEAKIQEQALQLENVQHQLEGKTVRKVIVVKGKVVNIVAN